MDWRVGFSILAVIGWREMALVLVLYFIDKIY